MPQMSSSRVYFVRGKTFLYKIYHVTFRETQICPLKKWELPKGNSHFGSELRIRVNYSIAVVKPPAINSTQDY